MVGLHVAWPVAADAVDLPNSHVVPTQTAKAAYDKACSFARENPRAAADIGIALGALLIRRITRR